jgi:hypothetical protein
MQLRAENSFPPDKVSVARQMRGKLRMCFCSSGQNEGRPLDKAFGFTEKYSLDPVGRGCGILLLETGLKNKHASRSALEILMRVFLPHLM